MSLYDTLCDYCSWNSPSNVKTFLSQNPSIDLTQQEGLCIQLAVKHKSAEMLEDLLRYFKAFLPSDNRSNSFKAIMSSMLGIFEEHVGFTDLPPDMKAVVAQYLPEVLVQDLIAAAAEGDIHSVRGLYPHCKDSTTDLLETATFNEQDGVIDVVVEMATTSARQKSIMFTSVADLYCKSGKLDKAQSFYTKSIVADPKYIISYIHYANALVEKLTASDSFDTELALKAEAHYRIAIEHNPKYSSAYKKLGILYQKMSENETLDPTPREEYGVKALKAYVGAINTKSGKLKYDSVYKEIEHISFRYLSTEEVQKIIAEDVKDERLHELFEALKSGSVSEDDSMSTDTLETLREMSEEDIEYEETEMDSDLTGLTGLTEVLESSSLVGESTALEGVASST